MAEGVIIKEGTFQNVRGQVLYMVDYLPPEGKQTLALIMWHHGVGEHVGRYHNFFLELASKGLAVCAFDAHGHGKSEPKEPALRVYLEKFEDMIDDYEQHLQLVKDNWQASGKPLPPIFAAGQSLGGLFVCHAVVRNPNNFAGLVLHSPLVDVEWTPVMRLQAAVGHILSALIPKTAMVPAVRPEDMSTDPEVVKAMMEDPLIYHGLIKIRTANELFKGFKKLPTLVGEAHVPLYVCHGSLDRCTSAKASRHLHDVWPHPDKTYNLIEGGYHEMLLGPEREGCFKAVIDWLLERCQPKSSL